MQIAAQQTAVGVRVGAHTARSARRERAQLGHQATGLVEQFFGTVATHPGFENRELARIGAHGGERNLVGTP